MMIVKGVAIYLLVSSFSLTIASVAVAQEKVPGSGLRISPTRTELTLDRGKSASIKITLKNVSGGDVIAKADVNDFEAEGETGDPKLLVNQGDKRTPTSVAPFLSDVKDVSLKTDESKEISIPVNIPSNTASGAYYGVVRYSAIPATGQNEPGKVSLTASVATLVLIEVPGNITQQIQLSDIIVYQRNKEATFFPKPPTDIGIRIKNTGNSFSKPFGRVVITNSFTNKEVYSYEMSNTTPRNNVLPGTTRVFKDALKNVSKPGRYTITAGISHGSGGEVITKRVSFWYIPGWLMFVLVVIVIGLLVSVFYLVRKLKKNNKRIKR